MIRSFADKRTESLARGGRIKEFEGFRLQALRRLDILNSATRIEDLMLNPGNRFHALGGDRQGQHAIWINRQWRICFRWTEEGPADVEITDYH